MNDEHDRISFRPMTAADVGVVPISHQGEPDEVLQRIADLGASAILAFDGDQHVGQLQFRRYEPGMRSPKGLWDPLYWADFADHAPDLPAGPLAALGYEIGQSGTVGERGRFVYLWTEAHPGTVVELSEVSGWKAGFFRKIAEAARQWDGADPVRRLPRLPAQ